MTPFTGKKIHYYLSGIGIFSCLLLAFDLFNHPLPFVDLIAYSYLNGINTYDLTKGANFYVTQFSYLLVHYIFRFLTIWGISPIASSTAVFSLQSFGIMVAFLILVKGYRISSLNAGLLSVFMLSCYMGLGQVVWGGPLYFSFGVMLSLLSFCAFIEDSPTKGRIIAGIFFAVAALISHPFSLPILSILLFSIFIFSKKEIRVFIILTFVMCMSIAATSANEFTQYYEAKYDLMAHLVTADLSLQKLMVRIAELFSFQSKAVVNLLGTELLSTMFFGYAASLIIIGAFLISCIWLVEMQKHKSIFNDTLKPLIVAVFLLFIYWLFAPDAPFGISNWTQRLLLAILPLSFALVFIFFYRLDIKLFKFWFINVLFSTMCFLVPTVHLYQLSELSKNFKSEIIRLEELILNTGIRNSFFFFDRIDVDPFWLRSMLFSLLISKRMEENNLFYITEWHGHQQHNIRSSASTNVLPTLSMPIHRKCEGFKAYVIDVNCEWLVPVPRFISRSMQISTNENTHSGTWYPLWVASQTGAVSLITVKIARSGNSFRIDHSDQKEVILNPGGLCSGLKMQVTVAFDTFRKKVSISCNGALAEESYPVVAISLRQTDPLGVNSVTSVLGDGTPLSKVFPGEINENLIHKIEKLK